jgi:hypothetical protein
MNIYPTKYPSGYYVYYYLRSKDTTQPHGAKKGSPYYVGKGTRGRAWSTLHTVKIPNIIENIIIIAENLTNDQAEKIEILHIAIWGRADIGTGILRNLTDGGKGSYGYKHSPEERLRISERSKTLRHSDATKARISRMGTGRTKSAEMKEKHRIASTGRKHTEETKKKLQEIRKRQVITDEHRRAMSIAAKKRKPRAARVVSEDTKLKLKQTWLAKKIKRLESEAKLHIANATDEQIKLYVENGLQPKEQKPRKLRKPHTQETKDKISKANKGKLPWSTGKSQSQETKAKISKANKGRTLGPRTRVSIEKGIATKIARYGKGG